MTDRFLKLAAAAFLLWPPISAEAETAAQFLGRGFANCDQYFEALDKVRLSDPPDLVLCHRFQYKPLYLYGYVRDRGAGQMSMTLVKDRRITCNGQGGLSWRGRGSSRGASASARFKCKDGAEGGLAFELETIQASGRDVIAGTIYGGVDENGSGGRDQEIHADFYIFSLDALRAILAER